MPEPVQTQEVAGQKVDSGAEKVLKVVDPMDPEAFFEAVGDGTESETLTTIHGVAIKGEKKTQAPKEEAVEPKEGQDQSSKGTPGEEDGVEKSKSKDNTVSGRIKELTTALHEAKTRAAEETQNRSFLEMRVQQLEEDLRSAKSAKKEGEQAAKAPEKPADGPPDQDDEQFYDPDTGKFLLEKWADARDAWKERQKPAQKAQEQGQPPAKTQFLSDMAKFDAADVEYGKENPDWKEVAPDFGRFLLRDKETPRFPELAFKVFNHHNPVEMAHALAANPDAAYKAAELHGAALDSHLSYVLGRFQASREASKAPKVVEMAKPSGSMLEQQPHIVTGAGSTRSTIDPKKASMDEYMSALGTG